MKTFRQFTHLGLLFALSLVAFLAATKPASATGNIVKSDLKGNWRIALRGNDGCGFATMLADVTINSSAVGTGTLQTHGQCGDSTLPSQTFTVSTLNPNGSGTASLSCGSGCGWGFDIQVSADRTKFNLVNVIPPNGSNFIEGEGVLKSTRRQHRRRRPQRQLADRPLQLTPPAEDTSNLVRFTLNTTGLSTNASETQHSAGCGDTVTSNNQFQILSLNSDGSGTAGLSCGSSCGWTFNIQVSPDRSTINLVDDTNPNNYLAGTAIRASSAADIVRANLAGAWQLALDGFGGCGNSIQLVTFTLNTSGASTSATDLTHASCGDISSTTNTFTITALNPDGSGKRRPHLRRPLRSHLQHPGSPRPLHLQPRPGSHQRREQLPNRSSHPPIIPTEPSTNPGAPPSAQPHRA